MDKEELKARIMVLLDQESGLCEDDLAAKLGIRLRESVLLCDELLAEGKIRPTGQGENK